MGRPVAPPIPFHLDIDDYVVGEGLQHGLPAELEAEAELELVDPLGFR